MNRPQGVSYSTDVAMRTTWLTLCDDFGVTCMSSVRAALAADDIPRFRNELDRFRLSYSAKVGEFKALTQLLNWTKRYRFAKDLFSDEELRLASWNKYSDVQLRLTQPIPVDKLYAAGFVARWRNICASILGKYTEAEHFERCAFAKNACVGHPARRRGLDQKLKGPLTGSTEHILFFRRYVESDPTLKRITQDCAFRPVPSLRLTFVPKSFKALRAIMPDTLLGSFYSHGLGRMMQDRLAKAGLNINTLQRKHRKLACLASRVSGWKGWRHSSENRLATVDLSSASDSISIQLLSLILPRKWFKAVTRGRVASYTYDGNTYKLMSACTMGLGHTFPLETLVFYVITKDLMERYGYENLPGPFVYGDDIIAPSGVIVGKPGQPGLFDIFRMLHIEPNRDKSFVGWCDFRESCGGDFYRGHNVRPASPEGSFTRLTPFEYASFLYKLANSLLRQWNEFALETTLAWISTEIFRVIGEVHVIPDFFPDTSGLKVQPGCYLTDEPETINFGSYVVRYLLSNFGKRAVLLEEALLWDGLRRRQLQLVGETTWFRPSTSAFSIRTRVTRTRKGHKRVSLLCVVDPNVYKGTKPAKSVIPNWLKTSSGVPR